jgi:hypothetical protein
MVEKKVWFESAICMHHVQGSKQFSEAESQKKVVRRDKNIVHVTKFQLKRAVGCMLKEKGTSQDRMISCFGGQTSRETSQA